MRNRALSAGSTKLDKSLDVVRLIKSIANLKTLLRLLLLKNERQLLAYQRRESVLELDRKVEASSSSGGGDFEQLKAKLKQLN